MTQRREWLALILILLVAVFVRLPHLGRESFWLDEAYTWYLTLPAWREVWGVMLLISDTSPLYYVATRLLYPLIGRSEFSLRYAALMPEVLAIPVVYRLGKDLFNRATGLWAALLLTLSPFAVQYARDARPYGFYLLFAALAVWGFWRWAERGRGPGLLVGASAALYLTHYASALFAFAQLGFILADFRRNPLRFRRWFGWQTLAALPTALYILAFLLRRQPITANTWIPKPDWLAPAQTLLYFVGVTLSTVDWRGVVVSIASVIALLATLRPPLTTAKKLLLWWLGLPMLAAWLFSLRLPAYVDRYFLPEIIAFVILLGAGLAHLARRSRLVAYFLLFSLCAGMLSATVTQFFDPDFVKEDWRGAAQLINTQYADWLVLAQDGETLLGLLPYRASSTPAQQALPATLDATSQPALVVLRGASDSTRGLTDTVPMAALGNSPLAAWFTAHTSRVRAVYRFANVTVVVIQP